MSNPDSIRLQDGIGLTSSQTVGLIVGVVSGGTILVILVLIASLACRFWFHRRSGRARFGEDAISPVRGGTKISTVPSVLGGERAEAYRLQEVAVTSRTFQTNVEEEKQVEEQEASPAAVAATETQAEPEEITVLQVNGDISRPQPIGTDFSDGQAPAMVIQPKEFPRDDLMLQEKMGEGEYGPIYRGEAYGLGPNNTSKAVTVKMLSPQEASSSRPLFDMDIEMLSSINHLNVVGLLAVCTKDSPECVLLEAGLPGDLLTYVRGKKDTVAPHIATEAENKELLRISDEISLGMAYLASERFIHKDLALRNCIIGPDGVIKISHFGLGPLVYPEAYYRVNETDLPIRWMSPEAITSANFTTRSDVWSYGVTLWELFMYGDHPYEDLTDTEVLDHILGGQGHLGKPMKCSNDIFAIMMSCWKQDPYERISFLDIHEKITELAGFQSPLSGATPISPLSPMTPSGMMNAGYFPSTFKPDDSSTFKPAESANSPTS